MCVLGSERRAAGALCGGDEMQHCPAPGRLADPGETGQLWTVPEDQLEDYHVRHAHSSFVSFEPIHFTQDFQTHAHVRTPQGITCLLALGRLGV